MPLHGEYEPSTDTESREQVEAYLRSGGREANTMLGSPIIVVTMRGARSGKLRRIPLMRVEADGEYALVASLGGAPQHPAWYYNLVAHPIVEIHDGPLHGDYLVAEVDGELRRIWWDRAVAAYPSFADYEKLTTRVIPVFVLSPIDETTLEATA